MRLLRQTACRILEVRQRHDDVGDDARTPRFVRTVQRYGYAFHGSAMQRRNRVRLDTAPVSPAGCSRRCVKCCSRRGRMSLDAIRACRSGSIQPVCPASRANHARGRPSHAGGSAEQERHAGLRQPDQRSAVAGRRRRSPVRIDRSHPANLGGRRRDAERVEPLAGLSHGLADWNSWRCSVKFTASIFGVGACLLSNDRPYAQQITTSQTQLRDACR